MSRVAHDLRPPAAIVHLTPQAIRPVRDSNPCIYIKLQKLMFQKKLKGVLIPQKNSSRSFNENIYLFYHDI